MLYSQVTSRLPAHFSRVLSEESTETIEPDAGKDPKKPADFVKGKSKVLFEGDTVGGVKRKATYKVSINMANAAMTLAPDQLDPVFTSSFKRRLRFDLRAVWQLYQNQPDAGALRNPADRRFGRHVAFVTWALRAF